MLVKQRAEGKNKLAHSVFVKIDKDKSGQIDHEELQDALKRSKSEKLKDLDDQKV